MIHRISEAALLDAIFRLRVIAWATEGVSFCDADDDRVFDKADPGAEHYGIIENGKVVAAVRVSYHAALDTLPMPNGSWYSNFEYPVALLSRLVVHPDSRRRDKGSSLAKHAATQALRSEGRTHIAYVNARCIFRALSESGFSSPGDAVYPWGNRELVTDIMVRSLTTN